MASRCPELPRARFRILFFALLAGLCATLGWWPAAAIAGTCLVLGLLSLSVARTRGRRLALSFATLDWVGLGLIWGAAGGAGSPLLWALPVLLAAHLLPTPADEWAYVTAPVLAGIAVLWIADPAFGADRSLSVAKLIASIALGFVPSLVLQRGTLLRRRRRPRRPATRRPAAETAPQDVMPLRTASVDPTTELPGLPRIAAVVSEMMREAANHHEALGIVCLRLVHWDHIRVRGDLAAEAAAAAVARHIRRHIRPRDEAFRVQDDVFVLALRDRTTSQSAAAAAALSSELSAHHLGRGGEPLSVACGVASFPAIDRLDDLLREAATAATADLRPDLRSADAR